MRLSESHAIVRSEGSGHGALLPMPGGGFMIMKKMIHPSPICGLSGAILLCLLPHILFAQDVPAPDDPQPSCQVSGTVVQKENREPIKNARITLQPEDFFSKDSWKQVRTGADGKFCIVEA